VNHRRQRQDPEVQPLQRQRRPAGRARRGGDFLPRDRRHLRGQGRRDALRPPPPRPSCAPTGAGRSPEATPTEQDWSEEYLAPIISIKVVAGVDEAIAHINYGYSAHHTDAIVTRDHVHAQRFLREVDSASVMVNASTRFADGFEYGLGAEIGISTDKFHARGPVGIEGLTSLKWVVLGQGEVRAEAAVQGGEVRCPCHWGGHPQILQFRSTFKHKTNKAAAWFRISSPP
jgi:hypothetical protein